MTDDLITFGVRRDEDLGAYEVYVKLNGETHYDTPEEAQLALREYVNSLGPRLLEPRRCIVIPRPERHISTLKIDKNVHMVRFCVPCKVYTTISACPSCGVPTLASGRPPGEDAGVRARREQAARDARQPLRPPHGTVTETEEWGTVIDVEATEPTATPSDSDLVRQFQRDYQDAAPDESVTLVAGDRRVWVDPSADSQLNGVYEVVAMGDGGCRRCSECEGQLHHWQIELDDDERECWGCKHCDVLFDMLTECAEVDYHVTHARGPEMVKASAFAVMVEQVTGSPDADVLLQTQMPDASWQTVERVQPYDSSHCLFLLERHGFARRHVDELVRWRAILSPCKCDEPDGPCEGCDDPHGHTCRACDEEWCQACWLGDAHAESCPPATRAERAG